jgi:LacI family repressor for deo operon, udp, cdd, tsx, nupC, and nupG
MITRIADVAQRAGVSTATVSRAIRGLPRVSDDTRERVMRAAAELGYVISPQASTLVTGRTRTVGIVVPFVDKWFFGQVVAGVDSVLRANDFDLLLYNLGDARGRRRFFDQMPVRRRVDALIVLSLPLTAAEMAVLAALEVPVALVGASAPACWSVRIDDQEGASKAVQHLLNLGHRRIGLICGVPDEPMRFTAPVDRRSGYHAALKRAGIPLDARLEAPADFTIEGGAAAMAELLTLAEPPTAVFAQSDELALGALRTLRRMGLRVPGDMSVVGFDDHEMAELFELTTIAQRVVEQGVLVAGQVLDALLSDGAAQPAEIIVPTRLVVRASTAPRSSDVSLYSAPPRSVRRSARP